MPFGVRGYVAPGCKASQNKENRLATCQQMGHVFAPKVGVRRGSQEQIVCGHLKLIGQQV